MVRLEFIDGIHYLYIIGRTEHFKQESGCQFRSGEVKGVVPFMYKREQAMV